MNGRENKSGDSIYTYRYLRDGGGAIQGEWMIRMDDNFKCKVTLFEPCDCKAWISGLRELGIL